LAGAFMKQLTNHPPEVRQAYASWASEIAADAFAFVHTGYASVAALHDVLSGSAQQVFMHHTNDPHPVCYVRVLMGTEMCRQFYGSGPWDELEEAFRSDYDIRKMRYPSIDLVQQCTAALPDVVRLILRDRYHAFNNNSLCKLIPPENVSPSSLQKLEYIAGPALFTSHAWIWKECIRLLALVGYRIATGEGDLTRYYRQQEEWMIRLGFTVELN
ncbi:MAG TPA: hypothetical protein VFZ78_12505, partial [Flavisolibacter sp.]